MTLHFFAEPTARSPMMGRLEAGAQCASRPTEQCRSGVDSAQRWRLYATDAQDSGDPARALQCWREVARRQADALDAMFHIGCCHALLQQPGRACLIFDALAHAPGTPDALRQRCTRLLSVLDPVEH